MKRVLGIVYEEKVDEPMFEIGCGGTETWIIQLAKEFTYRDFHVIVFSMNDTWKFSQTGVEYVPLKLFKARCSYQQFEAIILTRNINPHIYDVIVETKCTENIFVQSHDMHIWENGLYRDRFNYQDSKDAYPLIKKYIALTNYHYNELIYLNKIPSDMIEIIGNGVDNDIYYTVAEEYDDVNDIEESILWTSAFGRGGDILVDDILPLVQTELPNFKVKICGYGDGVPQRIKDNPSVEFLGTLTKEDYYREFLKHSSWFLPCVVVEDFGICAAEAIMCNCNVISPFMHGMYDVLNPFVNLAMTHSFGQATIENYHYGSYNVDKECEEYRMACREAATMIVESYRKYTDPTMVQFRRSQKNYILNTHTWYSVCDKWINLLDKTNLLNQKN